MNKTTIKGIDEYIAFIPKETQTLLKQLRGSLEKLHLKQK